MTNQIQSSNKYDLEERTARFGETILDFVLSIEQTLINKPLLTQIIRSSTSIGANYMEADAANSKRDFHHKIALCKKESKETLHWLRMIVHVNPHQKSKCRILYTEAHELCLIFSAILRKK